MPTLKITDARIYVTPLSAADIKTLSNTPTQINNLGQLHTDEFIEENGNLLASDMLISQNATSVTWDETNKRYTIVSPVGDSSVGYGPRINNTNSKKIFNWGETYKFTFEVYSPVAATIGVDYNNYSADSSVTLSGNDNDVVGSRLAATWTIPANTWTRVVLGSINNDATKNPQHVPLYDQTYFGIKTSGMSGPVTWYVRDPQWYIATDIHSIQANGIVHDNFFKEDSLNSFASIRNNEKAFWATELIEK